MPTLEAIHWGPASKATPRQLVVLCHGLGADAYDLIDLAPAWQHACPDALFASVHAPFSHNSGFGRQWWSVADRSPPVVEAGVRAAGALSAWVHRRRTGAAGAAAGGLRDHGLQPGRDDGAVHRPAAESGAEGDPGVLGRAGGTATLPAELANRAPVLIVHGEADDVVPVSRSHDAETALTAAGVPVDAHYVPRLGHGIDDTGISLGALALQRGFA